MFSNAFAFGIVAEKVKPADFGYSWAFNRKGWVHKKNKPFIPFRDKPDWIKYIPIRKYKYNFVKLGWFYPEGDRVKTFIPKASIPEWDRSVPATPAALIPDFTKSPLAQGFKWDSTRQAWYHPSYPKRFIARDAAPGWFFYIPGVRKKLMAEYVKLWSSGQIPKDMTFDQWLATRPITEPVVEPEVPTPTPEPAPSDGGGGDVAPVTPGPATPSEGEWVIDPLTGELIYVPKEAPAAETPPGELPVAKAGFDFKTGWPILGIIGIGAFLMFRGGKDEGKRRRRR